MDETYINAKGQWKYYYRAVDKYGHIVDFLLCDRRDEKTDRAFFTKAIGHNGWPEKWLWIRVFCSSQTGHLAKRHFAFQSSLA